MVNFKILCIDLLEEKQQHFYHKTFQRHLDDLDRFKDSEVMRFNEKLGNLYIMLIESFSHYKGELAGKNLKLEKWQIAVLGIMSGWEKLNSRNEWIRRFSTALIFIGRKNGKSLFASAYTVADMLIRSEDGNEIWFGASKREQSKLCWDGVEQIIRMHTDLKKDIHVAYSTIHFKPNTTTFKTLGRDSKNEDGFSAGIGVVDELHAHPDRGIFDIINSSMGARKQPLMLIITTAGFNLNSPLVPEYAHGKSILNGTLEDDDYFAFIAEPDLTRIEEEEDYKFTEHAMRASNPNMGVSIHEDFLLKEAKGAKSRPDLLNNYLVKHLNLFVAQKDIFLPIDRWRACCVDDVPDLESALYKFIGVDLSLVDDFTSKSCLYMFSGNKFYLTTHHYIPKDNVRERARQLRVPLEKWVTQGYVTATEGDVIDLDYIYEDIKKDLDTLTPCEFGYDPYRAKQLVGKINNELGFQDTIAIRQGFLTISEPTKMLLDIIKRGELTYENNPVTNWHASNMTILSDPAGNIKPDKSDPNRKIDGIASIIDALALAIPHVEEEEQTLFTTF